MRHDQSRIPAKAEFAVLQNVADYLSDDVGKAWRAGEEMNRYIRQFSATCPNNGEMIVYRLMIETEEVIMVEDIVAATDGIGQGFHEVIADDLHALFGGRQILTAHHHGVDILTRRGGE